MQGEPEVATMDASSDPGRLISQLLLEAPCAECGKYAMTVEKSRPYASFECPACKRRTFVVQGEKECAVFSETRLGKLVRHARSKRWFCPEHAGEAVEIVQVQADGGDPRRVTLHYLCRRGNRLFGRRRVHAGTIPLDLFSLEPEMIAGG